jgi:hypothetical protein
MRIMLRKNTRLAFLLVLMSCALLFAVPIEHHPVIFVFAAIIGHVGLVQSARLEPMGLSGVNPLPSVG